jgi:hypothetical protein
MPPQCVTRPVVVHPQGCCNMPQQLHPPPEQCLSMTWMMHALSLNRHSREQHVAPPMLHHALCLCTLARSECFCQSAQQEKLVKSQTEPTQECMLCGVAAQHASINLRQQASSVRHSKCHHNHCCRRQCNADSATQAMQHRQCNTHDATAAAEQHNTHDLDY